MPFRGQNEKNEKSEYIIWKRMKSLRKESVLIFMKCEGKGEFQTLFNFFRIPPQEVCSNTFSLKSAKSEY